MTDQTLTATHGAWTATFKGGRLAEVYHESAPDRAVDCFEVAGWQWETGGPFGAASDHRPEQVTPEQLASELAEWAQGYGETVLENEVPYGR